MFLIVLKVLDAPEGLDIDMERNVSVARIRQDNDGEKLIYLHVHIIVEKTLNQKYRASNRYGFVRIFTEKHNLLRIKKCRIRIRKTPAPPILMKVLYYRSTRYGKSTKNTQIVSATVRKR